MEDGRPRPPHLTSAILIPLQPPHGRSRSSKNLPHGAMGLVDGRVGLCRSRRIGIGDGDAAEWLASDHPGLVFFLPLRIKKRVRTVSIAVRPAVDSNALDVAGGIESGRSQHGSQLLADIALEGGKSCAHEFHSSGAILIAGRQSRLARSAKHEQDHRLLRIAGKVIAAETHWEIQSRKRMIAAW